MQRMDGVWTRATLLLIVVVGCGGVVLRSGGKLENGCKMPSGYIYDISHFSNVTQTTPEISSMVYEFNPQGAIRCADVGMVGVCKRYYQKSINFGWNLGNYVPSCEAMSELDPPGSGFALTYVGGTQNGNANMWSVTTFRCTTTEGAWQYEGDSGGTEFHFHWDSPNACPDFVPPGTFTFPDQWEAVVGRTLSDEMTKFQLARSTGYLFTDYSLGAKGAARLDEVWNVTSIAGTQYASRGIHSDVHLSFGTQSSDPGFFFFTNASGLFCETSPAELIPKALNFSGNTVWKDVTVSTFKASESLGTLYVDQASQAPLAYILPAMPERNFLGSTVEFISYTPKPSPLARVLFTHPSNCSSPSSPVLSWR